MKKIFSRKVLAVLIAALLIAGITGVSLIVRNSPGVITGTVETLLKPLKTVCASVAGVCEKIYGYMNDYDRLIEENAALRAQMAGADRDKREYDTLEAENQRLRELLGLAQKNEDYSFDSASIIAWSSSSYDSSFTINKGSANSTLAVGDPIITSSGDVVGVVKTVSETSSVCISLLDTTFAVSVNLEGLEDAASAKGNFALMKSGRLQAEYLEDSNMVFAGDSVVTSGKGGVFPEGLLVGYVTEVKQSQSSIDDVAVIEPAADLDQLLYVYIITDFAQSE